MGILSNPTPADGRPPTVAPAATAAAAATTTATGLPASVPDDGRSGPPAPALPPPADGRSELQRRRDRLAEQVTELHWDLGGLTYEMAIRDHFRLDVLVRRAARLQERDAELAEVERLLRMEQGGVAGACPSCSAPHSRGAVYCWQCGATLMERIPSAATDQPTVPAGMDALIAGTPAPQVAPGSDG